MNNRIVLLNGTRKEYLTPADGVQNARQVVAINESSTLDFELARDSSKWDIFDLPGTTAEVNGRVYCIYGESSSGRSRDSSGLHLPVSMKELWYKLKGRRITAHNVDIANVEVDHIDTHMVYLLGNSPDALYINGQRFNAPHEVGTSKYLVWCMLRGSGWELDPKYDAYWPDGKYDLETDKKTVLENIQQLQEFFGGMLLWDSANKLMALVDEGKYQAFDGFDIRYRKNLISIERDDNYDIITRLYPYGNSNLNIAAINSNREYLDDFSYTSEVIEGILQNNNIHTQEYLLDWAKRRHTVLCRPRHTYTVDIFRLVSEIGKDIPQPEIGKLAKVYDPDVVKGGSTLQRIIRIAQNVFSEWDCDVTIGDVQSSFESLLKNMEAGSNKADNSIDNSGRVPGINIGGSIPQLDKSNIHWNGVTSGLDNRITNEISFVNSTIRDTENKLQTSITQTASQIRLEASDMKRGLESSISITAGEIRSEVRDVRNGLESSISQTAGQIRSEVRDIRNGLQSSITQNSNRIALVVSGNGIRAAEIVASINSSGSQVKISADHVDIQGYVTFSDLSTSGRTTIHGGNIQTNSITADKLAANSISAQKIQSGAITADKLAAGVITADKISANAVLSKFTSSTQLNVGSINFNGQIAAVGNGNGTVRCKQLVVSGYGVGFRSINASNGTFYALCR